MSLTSLDTGLAGQLAQLLPDRTLSPAEHRYLSEPRGLFVGQPAMVAKPRNTQEVAAIVRFCHDHRIAIVPFGGGTGLVGGQIKPTGAVPLILSLERMTAIRDLRPADSVVVCDAGVILSEIQAAADAADRMFPLSLASEASCRIGGNLATNAGGVQVLRYGNMRDLCLGIEAVMPDGAIYHGLGGLRKDNTGYDLRHLLVGSEGTLGVITGATLRLFPKPRERATVFAIVDGPDQAVELLALLQGRLDSAVSGFELMHRQGFAFLAETMPQVRLPFSGLPEWTVLAEATGGENSRIDDRMMSALEEAMEAELVTDAVLAQSEQQRDAFWAVRESIPEANRHIGSISSHDVSVPIPRISEFIYAGFDALAGVGDMRVNCFGHLGDGNLHYNVFPAPGRSSRDYQDLRPEIKKTVHDLVHDFGGSVSAEHGIGRLKTGDLITYGDPAKLAAIRAIKAALDPRGIMNPGVIVPEHA